MTTESTVRPLDVIAAEFRAAVENSEVARTAYDQGSSDLLRRWEQAQEHERDLREELWAAIVGRTVAEQRQLAKSAVAR